MLPNDSSGSIWRVPKFLDGLTPSVVAADPSDEWYTPGSSALANWSVLKVATVECERGPRITDPVTGAHDDAPERERLELERARLTLARERLEAARDANRSVLPQDRLWSEDEAASYLRMSTRWLRDSIVPKVLLPGAGKRPTVRYEPDQVSAWAKAHSTHSVIDQPTPKPPTKKRRTRQ